MSADLSGTAITRHRLKSMLLPKSKMNLEHRIGQLLIIGLPGPQLDLMTRSLLQSIQPGGVLLNTHNIESGQQVAELTSTLARLLFATSPNA